MTRLRKPPKPITIFHLSVSKFILIFLFLSMAFFFLFILFFFFPSHSHSSSVQIQQACKATRFPQQCHTSLNNLPPHPTPLQTIQSAIDISSSNLNTARSKINSIVDASAPNHTRTTVVNTCLRVLRYSHHRTSLAAHALPRGMTKDARAWMSAALAYQYNCWSGLKYINDTALVAETMSFLETLTALSSNALSMMVSYDLFGNDTASWRPPLTERDGFWEPSGSDLVGSGPALPATLTPDVTVCKDGGCYKTVQEAVNAAPDNGERRFVIHIKEGVYEERVRVPLRKRNVVFLGDGMGKTVITGSANVGLQPGMTTYDSATVGEILGLFC